MNAPACRKLSAPAPVWLIEILQTHAEFLKTLLLRIAPDLKTGGGGAPPPPLGGGGGGGFFFFFPPHLVESPSRPGVLEVLAEYPGDLHLRLDANRPRAVFRIAECPTAIRICRRLDGPGARQ